MTKSWNEKMSELYSERKKKKIVRYIKKNFPEIAKKFGASQVSEKAKMKVWFGTMSNEAKKERSLSYEEIDSKMELLLSKGYRLVKSSAITPKGIFSTQERPTQNESPNASNLFFELRPNYKDFVEVYDRFGRYENNFPDYFETKEKYDEYAEKSDIIVIEDIKTNKPVGFLTYNVVEAGSPDAKEYKDDCGLDIKKKLIYNDTVVLSSELQGKGIGRLVNDIVDGYYLQYFGQDCDYGLYTGEINTDERGRLSKDFHEHRGFTDWVESSAFFEKWKNRYQTIDKKAKNFKGNYKDFKPQPMYDSYRGL